MTLASHIRVYIKRFLTVYAKDIAWIFLIAAVALATRLPAINHPTETVFDEAIYMNYIIYTVTERPFFDIHPPLARMIFAAIVDNTEFSLWASPIQSGQTFTDFPFLSLRMFSVTLGTLLPILLFLGARLMGLAPPIAALPSLLVIFDNAFIIYARTFLPDTFLIVLNILAFIAAVAALQTERRVMRVALTVVAGVTLGSAIAIKWTALGIWATIVFAYLLYRRWRDLIAITVLAATCYVFIFALSFAGFTAGGKVDPIFSYYQPSVGQLVYPRGDDLTRIAKFLPQFHAEMLAANKDDKFIRSTLQTPKPFAWVIANSTIVYWLSRDGTAQIRLAGNAFVWSFAFFTLLFTVSRSLIGWIYLRKTFLTRTETILIFGYAANYLPFFLIERPMFLYHYFTSLLFLFLLLPHIAPSIFRCVRVLVKSAAGARALMLLFLFLVALNMLLLLPDTYGW